MAPKARAERKAPKAGKSRPRHEDDAAAVDAVALDAAPLDDFAAELKTPRSTLDKARARYGLKTFKLGRTLYARRADVAAMLDRMVEASRV